VERLSQRLFHMVCVKHYKRPEHREEEDFQVGLDEAKRFFNRFNVSVEIMQKTVLDVGCGLGSCCIYMALNGAKKVAGVDIDERRISFAKSKIVNAYQNLSEVVEFRVASDLKSEKFDIIISKDSFEHYADPENLIITLKQHLNEGGIVVIGFGPLWKAPYGGHIGYMTKVPWAHLLFRESVIMRERKRFRPDEDAESFEQVRGGLNKMTVKRCVNAIAASGLKIEYFETNVSRRKLVRLFKVLRRIPFCRDLFTQNLYTIARLRD